MVVCRPVGLWAMFPPASSPRQHPPSFDRFFLCFFAGPSPGSPLDAHPPALPKLDARLGVRLEGTHRFVTWLAEHAAGVLPKEVGIDGRTGHEKVKGKPCSHEVAGFTDTIHFRCPKGPRRQEVFRQGSGERDFSWVGTGVRGKPSRGQVKG